jgi:hypothetical protein
MTAQSRENLLNSRLIFNSLSLVSEPHMIPFRPVVIALCTALLAGCSSSPRGTPLPADEFQALRQLPSTPYGYSRYVGPVNGYETLEIYESPSNSGLTPIKSREYYLDPDFYLREIITLRYSRRSSPLSLGITTSHAPFSITAPVIHETRVTVDQVNQKSPHPSIAGEIDKVTFKLQPGQTVPKYPNCQTIILLYDQHNLMTGKKFASGDTWLFTFSKTGQFQALTPLPSS